MHNFLSTNKKMIANAIKLGDYNVGRNNGLLTLPMYMSFLLREVLSGILNNHSKQNIQSVK